MEKKYLRWISSLQHILYVLFVLLWFKDNFSPLKRLPVSYPFALVLLLGLSLGRFILKYRCKNIRFSRKISKETAALLALLLLAVAFRIPCLLYPSGMMTSDDAVAALMGKHISEGKVPPVCFYGQLYIGSLSSHFFALVFKVFGYSMFILKAATLLIFLTFMIVQFFFLQDVFNYPFALSLTFFYSLPFVELVTAGLDNSLGCPLVLLFGALLLYLAYLISFKARENLLPGLGFLMGLSLWTHQITTAFILTGLLFLLLKTTFRIKKYALLFFYAVLGFLPQLLAEIFSRFQLVAFLKGQQSTMSWKKISWALKSTASLFSADTGPLELALLLLMFSGFIYLIFLSWKKKMLLSQSIFPFFFLFFYLLYFLSRFSNTPVIRYLYPVYVCLPVLVSAPFLAFKQKLRAILPVTLAALLFFDLGLKGTLADYKLIKSRHLHIARTLAAMEATGKRYWSGEYWAAYLLTAVSKERLIVDSYSSNRYSPYTLARWNQDERDNYVFLWVGWRTERVCYANLIAWLETLGLRAKTIQTGEGRLIYDVESRLNPEIFEFPPPRQLPHLELKQIDPLHGYLHLTFTNESSGPDNEEFWLRVEIPGFSSKEMRFSASDKEVQIHLPYPPSRTFSIRYAVKYLGIRIPSSAQEQLYSLPQGETQERNDSLVFLSGLGPEVEYQGEKRTVCEREVSFELNGLSSGNLPLSFYLDSPFEFSSVRWYGKFSQRLKIEVNSSFLAEKELRDGANIIPLVIPKKELKENGNIITLKFRYHLWFDSYPSWEIAAFLRKIEVSQQASPTL